MILFSPPIEMLKSQILILKKKNLKIPTERVKERVRRSEEENAKLREIPFSILYVRSFEDEREIERGYKSSTR